MTKYQIVILDKIACQSFVDWTYEENSETEGRKGLLDLHTKSAINVALGKPKILALTSVTKSQVEQLYKESKGAFHISSLIEASEELYMPLNLSEDDSILKLASLLKWRGIIFTILTGNSLLYDKAKKMGFDVHYLKNSEDCLK